MSWLIVGLILFLGQHSLRLIAPRWRESMIARLGAMPFKGLYAVLSIATFVVLVWGYGLARAQTPILWNPPGWTHHVTALFVLLAFYLFVAGYLPGTKIKARIGHPMTMGITVWAFAHLWSNGSLADVILFGAFLVWSHLVFHAARKRQPPKPGTGSLTRDAFAALIGLVLWGLFAHFLHLRLIGVAPFGA
jgi:uncharacterized membrane protein